MTQRYLILGSNSFSGAQMVAHLLGAGHDVMGVSRSPQAHPLLLPYRFAGVDTSRFTFVQADMNRDLPRLLETVGDFRPDYLINFAALGMVAQSWQAPADWYQTNVVGQVRLHEGLRKLDFLKTYVHVTTPEVYGSTDGWITERFHFAPSTPYAVSRAACDLHLMSFFKAYDFPVVFTRAANVYGAGQQLYRIIPRTMLYARLGKRLQLHGGGYSMRAFIHMRDVAAATEAIATRGVTGESYHISTRESLSIRALVERICTLTGVAFDALVEPSEERLGKDQAYLLESAKLRSALGWADTVSLDAGLAETLAWVDAHLDTLRALPLDYIHQA